MLVSQIFTSIQGEAHLSGLYHVSSEQLDVL